MPCCLARALLVRQRTQTGALRGHLAEFGLVAPRGTANVERLRREMEEAQEPPPAQVAGMAELLFDRIASLTGRITGLEQQIRIRAREREEMKRLMTIPGIGPVCAMAVHAFAPPMASFRRGRDSCLGRAGTAGAFHGRPAAAGADHQDAAARSQAAAGARCHRGAQAPARERGAG